MRRRGAISNSFVMLLTLIVVVVLVSVFLVGTVSYRTSARSLEEQTREATLLREAQLLSRMDLSILGYQSIAQALGGNKSVLDHLTQTSSKTVEDILRFREIMLTVSSLRMANPQVSTVGVYFKRSGTVLTDNTRYTSAEFFERYDPDDRAAILQGIAAARPFTRKVPVRDGDAHSEVLLLVKSLPYYSAYPFGGVIVEVPMRHLEQMLTPERDSVQLVLSERGELLMTAGQIEAQPLNEVISIIGNCAPRPGESFWMDASLGGKPYFLAVTLSAVDSWQFATLIPQQSIYGGVYSIRLVTLITAFVTAVIAILVAWLILKRLYGPVRELLSVMATRGAPYLPARRGGSDLMHISRVIDLAWRENERMQGLVEGIEDVMRQDVFTKLLDDIAVDEQAVDKLKLSGMDGCFRVALPDKLKDGGSDYALCIDARDRASARHPEAADLIVLAREHNQAVLLLYAARSRAMQEWAPMLRALADALGQGALLVVSDEVRGLSNLHSAKTQARQALYRALTLDRTGVVPAQDMMCLNTNELIRHMSNAPERSLDALRGLYAGAMENGDYPLAYLADALLRRSGSSEQLQSALVSLSGETPEGALDALVRLQPAGAGRFPGRRITFYLKEHYQNPNLSLAMLSDVFGYTSSYISTLLKEETGMGFLEYLTRLRLDAAAELLTGSDRKVADIAQDVGFGHVNTFIRAFRKRYQQTPAQYRANPTPDTNVKVRGE